MRRLSAALSARRKQLAGRAATGVVLLALLALALASAATAHWDGYFTNRINAQIQVRSIMLDDYSWFVFNVRCGSSTWAFGKHFPCTFSRLGKRYIVCYHSLDYDYGIVTSYRSWSCRKLG